ncbi:MAG: ABC transporter ATP-binding protein/permease [Actinomycetota bacterium]|nr:ABC transporter ATP-binding protein/permease [Actinomycetota bacterium]
MASMPRTLGGKRWRILALLIGNGFAQAAAAVAAALSVERAFGMLEQLQRPSGAELAAAAGVLTAAAAATAALRGRERVDAERLGQAYTHRLRMHLFEHLTEMSARTVGQKAQGSTAMRFVGDLTVLRRWVSRGLARLVVAGTMATGALVALAFVSLVLAISVAVTILVGASLSFVQGKALRSADRYARRRRSRLAGNVNEKIGAIGVVQAHGAVDRETRRMKGQSRKLRDAMVHRAGRLGRLDAIAEATASVAVGAVLITGVMARVPAPTVAASMVVVGLLSTQVRGLGRVQEYWQGARVSREAIQRFLDRPTMQRDSDSVPLEAGPGRLEIKGLTLEGAVSCIDADVEAGSTVAIVGPNGAGKSTLLALVARMVDADSGVVRLDGQDLAAASIDDVRDAIGFVAADLPLLRGSLLRNLTYRHPKAENDEIADIATRCGLDGLISRLDDGVETRIAEGGRDLSSGERQRVLLARALLGHPPLLLLDEADANLDPATTGLVDDVLCEYDGTTLIVTHRRERLVSADTVWYIDGGHLVESGPPGKLLDGNGPMACFFASVPATSTAPDQTADAGR